MNLLRDLSALQKNLILIVLVTTNLVFVLLILSTANLNQAEYEVIEEVIEEDPFNGDSASRASTFALIPQLSPTPATAENISETPIPITPRATARPTITPTDEPAKPPYIFPVPINIPDYYFDPRAPTAKPRVTATPARGK